MALSEKELKTLTEKAHQIRKDVVQVVSWAGGGHIGGGLSQVEILVALYYKYLNIDPKRPDWPDRDRVLLSKGHGGVGYAPVLADKGYFDKGLLKNFNKTGSPFGMHLDRLKVKGVDASTGSLGHGLSMAVGLALGARMKKKKWLTWCIMGDGEQNEGSIWEAAMAAHQFKLGNLKAIVDNNKFCIDGPVKEIMDIEPLRGKWEAFGWKVIEADGHDFNKLCPAMEEAIAYTSGPCVVIAHTIKGKGVDFMENVAAWHYGGIDADKARKAAESIDRMYGGK
jgi:transketolase